MYVELCNKYVMITFNCQCLSQLLNKLVSQLALLFLLVKLDMFGMVLLQEVIIESHYGQFRGYIFKSGSPEERWTWSEGLVLCGCQLAFFVVVVDVDGKDY